MDNLQETIQREAGIDEDTARQILWIVLPSAVYAMRAGLLEGTQ
jgi:hypothetical protein